MKKLEITAILLSILTIGHFACASDMLKSTIFSGQQTFNEQMFQPADGSFDNGIYNISNNNAKTKLHNYTNVIAIDGTTITPKLNAQGKFVDKKNNLLEPIGSYSLYSSDSGNTNTYYIFGVVADTQKQTMPANNEPIETYTSQGE